MTDTNLTSPLGADRLGERERMYTEPTEELYEVLNQSPFEADRKRTDLVYDDGGLHHFIYIGYDEIVTGVRLNDRTDDGTGDFAVFSVTKPGFELIIDYGRLFLDTETKFETVQELLNELDSQVEYIRETEYGVYFTGTDDQTEIDTVWKEDRDDDLKGWIRERVEDETVIGLCGNRKV